jgi:general secretion pathway protein L
VAGRLLVRLFPETPPHAEWAPVDARGALAGPPESGPVEGLAEPARGHRVVGLVPGEEVLLTEAQVPARSRQRLLRALPYALEEQLAEDVESLHLAVPAGRSGGSVPVAVVARARVDAWLEALQSAGVAPERLVPETLALPIAPGEWHVLVEGERALVRTGPQGGFAIERAALAPLLRNALEEEGRPPPARVVVTAEADAVDEVRAGVADLAEVVAAPGPGPALPILARGLADRDGIDLLQGPYDRRASVTGWLRPWRAAALVALAWVALEAGVRIVDYQRLEAERVALAGRVEAVAREALPGTQRLVNPRVQLERALAAIQPGSASGAGFLAILAGTGEVLQALPGTRLLGLGYRAGRLDLDLEVPDLQALDRLKQQLAERAALEAEVQSVTAREGRVLGRLQVTRAGA